MIVVCPTCGAKYRLSDAALARNARLRCAACDHRWVPQAGEPEAATGVPIPAPPPRRVTEADEEAAFAAVQEQMLARWQTPAPVESSTAGEDGADSDAGGGWDVEDDFEDDAGYQPPSGAAVVLKTLVAVIGGIALSVVAAGLWLGQFNLSTVPIVGDFIDRLDSPPPLDVTVSGQTTLLASGKRLLEITGRIHNRTAEDVMVPPLKATLSGPAGVALRWRIAPPIASLAPGREVEFGGTVTGFPAEATTLSVRAGH